MTPSLAQLVRKWHRTYCSKNHWDFRYGRNKDDSADDFNIGYLTNAKYDLLVRPSILIEGNKVRIGEFRRLDWGHSNEWHATIYSDVEIIAADPRFFPKLERMMQFLIRSRDRRMEADKKFAKEEIILLKEVLR